MIDLTEPCPDCIHPRSDHTAPDNFAQHCLICGCNRNSNRNWDGPEAVAGEGVCEACGAMDAEECRNLVCVIPTVVAGEDETAARIREVTATFVAANTELVNGLRRDFRTERARAEAAGAEASRYKEALLVLFDMSGCDCDGALYPDNPWQAPYHASDCPVHERWDALDLRALAEPAPIDEEDAK